MVRKERSRIQAIPSKKTGFRLRGDTVDISKILRFKKRTELNDEEILSNCCKKMACCYLLLLLTNKSSNAL